MTTEVDGNGCISETSDLVRQQELIRGFATSDSIAKLVKALAAAQGEMVDPVKDAENPHYKAAYTTLVACTSAYRPVLSKHGLALTQWHLGDRLVSLLAHESGEWIRGVGPISPVKNDPQGIASATTYARRYASMAIVGLAPADDDDGNAASEKPNSTPKQRPAKAKPAVNGLGAAKRELLADVKKARGMTNSSLTTEQVMGAIVELELGKKKVETLEELARLRASILVNRNYDLDTAERIPGDARVSTEDSK